MQPGQQTSLPRLWAVPPVSSGVLLCHHRQLLLAAHPLVSQAAQLQAHRRTRPQVLCRCQGGEKPKPFLKQLGEWGARLFGGKPKRRPPSQKREQQQEQPLQQQQPPQHEQQQQSQSKPEPDEPLVSRPAVRLPRPYVAATAQPVLNELRRQVVSQPTADTVRRQMEEAIVQASRSGEDEIASTSESESSREWWTEEQPGMPDAPSADALWEEWQEFFSDMDENATWARHVHDEVEKFLSVDQYDLASKAQQRLDAAIKQDIVANIVKDFEQALKDQDYGKAVHLRDAGGAGLMGWWYAVSEDNTPAGGHLLQIVPEPHRGCYAGYMVTASDLCNIEAQQPKSMISGELGAWHAQQAQMQANPGSSVIIQGQEVKEEGAEAPQPATIDDFGHPIMEIYITQDAQGRLQQQATALQHVPPEFEMDQGMMDPDQVPNVDGSIIVQGELVSEDAQHEPHLQMDIQPLGNGPTMVSFTLDLHGNGEPLTGPASSPSQADSEEGSSSQDKVQRFLEELRQSAMSHMQQGEQQQQEQQGEAGSSGDEPHHHIIEIGEDGSMPEGMFMSGPVLEVAEGDEEMEVVRPQRLKASLIQLDRSSFKLNVLEERQAGEAASASAPSPQLHRLSPAASMHLSESAMKSREHVLQNLKSLSENTDGPEFQKLVQRLGKAMHVQGSPISSDHMNTIVRGIILRALESAVGALSVPMQDPAQEIAMHGLSGSTTYRRVPLDTASTDPFSGVFLDPFNSKGAELYLLERAKGEDGQDSMTAVKITSTENVSAGSVAFRASLAPQKRLSTWGFNEELLLSGRYKAQCRLASADTLNARWDDAELMQFSSRAQHGADLGLLTGGSGSGHSVAWLKRMHLPPHQSATISSS